MEWNAQIDRELRGLDGIVAVLLALAGLAERAAPAPYPIRCVVFWFLRQADAVAAGFVGGSASGAARGKWLVARMTVRAGFHSVDERDLALSLGMLAQTVAAMVEHLRRLAFLHRSRSGDKTPGTQDEVPGAFNMTASQSGRPDTS
jgi:hypothetical protein